MFTVTSITTHANISPPTPPAYANELADLQLPLAGIAVEYVNPTADSLLITTDTPSFIQSGTGNDTVIDNSKTAGDVVIDPAVGPTPSKPAAITTTPLSSTPSRMRR